MSAAADINPEEVSSESGAKKWRRMKAALHIESGSIDDASVHMLNLYRTNLDVRLRMIDEASLKSDTQKKLYATVIQMLTGPIKPSMRSRNIEWDEIYKAESLIALLYSGAQLQHEISTRLQELAVENLAEANALRRDYEDLLKPPGADCHAGRCHAASFSAAGNGGDSLERQKEIFGAPHPKRSNEPNTRGYAVFFPFAGGPIRLFDLRFQAPQCGLREQDMVAFCALDSVDRRAAWSIFQPAHQHSTTVGEYDFG